MSQDYIDTANRIRTEPRPKFGHRRGCTWEICTVVTPDGETTGRYDSTWGRWVHFEYRGKWHKVSMYHPAVDCMARDTINLTAALAA